MATRLIPVASAQTSDGPLAGYRVDIFYCEAPSPTITEARKKRADAAFEKLKKSASSTVARVRLLPTLVQARPGYQSFSDEIRFNDVANDKTAAAQLSKIIGIEERSPHRMDFKIAAYINVFYCSGK